MYLAWRGAGRGEERMGTHPHPPSLGGHRVRMILGRTILHRVRDTAPVLIDHTKG